jgi:hypothetical protein
MNAGYLEITYRHGKVFAAYLYLPRQSGDRVHHSDPCERGMVIDYSEDGRPLGIEITSPRRADRASVNQVPQRLHQPAVSDADLQPLAIAG